MTKIADPAPSVLLIGYYGYGNLGDSLFLKLLLERIETLAPPATQIFVKDLLPSDRPTYGLHVHNAPFDSTLADGELSRLKRATMFYRLLRRTMSHVNVVIYGGGSLFHSRDLRNLAILLLLNHTARRSNCKIIAIGVGIPRPRGLLRRTLLKKILSRLHAITVRDSDSYEVCMHVSSPERCRLASDLAFLEPIPELLIEPSLDVVFTLSASDFHSMDRLSRVASDFAKSLEVVVNSGCALGFMSFQEYDSPTVSLSDSAMLRRLLQDNESVFDGNTHVPHDFQDALQVVARYRYLAGMRYHSLIAAACLRRPFIGLGDDPKLVSLCDSFDMPRISLEDFSSQSLIHAVHNARWTSVQDAALERERTLGVANEMLLAEVFK